MYARTGENRRIPTSGFVSFVGDPYHTPSSLSSPFLSSLFPLSPPFSLPSTPFFLVLSSPFSSSLPSTVGVEISYLSVVFSRKKRKNLKGNFKLTFQIILPLNLHFEYTYLISYITFSREHGRRDPLFIPRIKY